MRGEWGGKGFPIFLPACGCRLAPDLQHYLIKVESSCVIIADVPFRDYTLLCRRQSAQCMITSTVLMKHGLGRGGSTIIGRRTEIVQWYADVDTWGSNRAAQSMNGLNFERLATPRLE